AIPPGSICGTRPCWRTSGTTGFRYKNADGMPDGITAANLRSGVTGRTSVSVKGKGANLPTPALGLTLAVTVQLVISDGVTAAWTGVCPVGQPCAVRAPARRGAPGGEGTGDASSGGSPRHGKRGARRRDARGRRTAAAHRASKYLTRKDGDGPAEFDG